MKHLYSCLPKLTQVLSLLLLLVFLSLNQASVTWAQGAVDDDGVESRGGIGGRVVDNDSTFGATPEDTLTQDTLDSLNPLIQAGDGTIDDDLTTPGGILSRALRFAFPIAGLILFVMLVWSGFEILGGATERKSLDTGKNRATAAVVGFLLLFASYWFVQIIEVVFGVSIL